MEVTDVRLRLVETDGRMKAIATIVLENSLAIHGIRVIQGNNKFFVAMPSKPGSDGEFRDIVHPINSEARGVIQDAVLAEYEQAVKEAEAAKEEQEEDTLVKE